MGLGEEGGGGGRGARLDEKKNWIWKKKKSWKQEAEKKVGGVWVSLGWVKFNENYISLWWKEYEQYSTYISYIKQRKERKSLG